MLNLSPRKSMENTTINDTRLSPHFKLGEFINLSKLLTGNGWLHISWNPFAAPLHDVRIGYYK
jgi:hypothetical protein